MRKTSEAGRMKSIISYRNLADVIDNKAGPDINNGNMLLL